MTGTDRALLTEVERAFSEELETGTLRIVDHRYFAEAFGDSFVVLEGFGLRLKLKHERSKDYALVASSREPEEWEQLQAVVSAVTGVDVPGAVDPVGWELGVAESAAIVRKHQSALATAYGHWWSWRATRRKLRILGRAQQARFNESLASPRSEAEKSAEAAAMRELENPSDALKAALKSLGLDE